MLGCRNDTFMYLSLNVRPFLSCPALKKPAITQKHDEAPDVIVGGGAGPGPGVGAADGPGGQGLSLDTLGLQQDRVEGRAAMIAPPEIVKPAEKAVVFEEDNKAGLRADELGEQQKQLRGIKSSADRHSLFRVGLGKLVHPTIPGRSTAAALLSLSGGVKCSRSRFLSILAC